MLANQRVFLRVIGQPFLTRLVLPLLVVLLLVSFADSNTDWARLKQDLAAAPAWRTALQLTVLIALWSHAAGQALRPVWQQPAIGFLVRQPLTHFGWALYLLPSLSIAFLPVAGALWLVQPERNAVLHYVALTGLAWPMLLGSSYRGAAMIVLFAGGGLLFGTTLFLYLLAPAATAFAALLVTLGLLPLAVRPIARQRGIPAAASAGTLRDLSAVRALVRRDLRCLVRTERKRLANLAATILLVALLMLAFRINGAVEGESALLIAAFLASLLAHAAYAPVDRLKPHLGKELFRLRWPVSRGQRASALLLLLGMLFVPGAAAIGLLASTMGVGNGLRFALYCATALVIAACTFGLSLGNARPSDGPFLLALLGDGLLLVALPGWAYDGLAVIGVVGGLTLSAKLLHAFAVRGALTQ